MASTKRRVQFSGVIQGNGHQAECEGWCLEVSLSGGPTAHTQYSIDTVSVPLPDGDYTVFAHGTSQAVRRVNGMWLARP
jgi:hypothetical protein